MAEILTDEEMNELLSLSNTSSEATETINQHNNYNNILKVLGKYTREELNLLTKVFREFQENSIVLDTKAIDSVCQLTEMLDTGGKKV